jgi:hypothetical protein
MAKSKGLEPGGIAVPRTFRFRSASFTFALALGFGLSGAHASAALDLVVGARSVVQNAPVTDCDTKAQTALNGTLQGTFEAGQGTHQWVAHGTPDNAGAFTSAAVIHCFPVGTGYVVTITCTAQVPPNADTATGICTKLATAFGITGAAQ